MNPRILLTMIAKDLKLYFKNRFFAFITLLGLVFFIGAYFLLPDSVDEYVELAVVSPLDFSATQAEMEEAGVVLYVMDDETELIAAVEDGDIPVGIVFPENLAQTLMEGSRPEVSIYFSADMPRETRDFYPILVQEWVAEVAGEPLNVDATEEVLGVDRAGEQIPARNRMLPLFAVFILMMETLGLGSLIAGEIATGTLQALLVTPLRVTGLFISKGIVGVMLAFSQAVIFVLATGGLREQPLLILAALLFGSMLVTGVAFLLASVSKDMMSVMAWGVLAMIILAIPAMNILLPGLTTGWEKAIPSYYLADTVHRAVNFHDGWGELGGQMAILLAAAVGFLGLGIVVLRRRMR
ncbi:MAG: ABC transporter permease [Anaerolineales bacterium]|nr:ABC transporter permease [Anaerolineales bacterium]